MPPSQPQGEERQLCAECSSFSLRKERQCCEECSSFSLKVVKDLGITLRSFSPGFNSRFTVGVHLVLCAFCSGINEQNGSVSSFG